MNKAWAPHSSHGFTIVELLIVIVVIGILATITIVSYTGIQNNARNVTAEQLAKTVEKKVAIFQAANGTIPTNIAAFEAYAAASLQGLSVTTEIPTDEKTVRYVSCEIGGGPEIGGAQILYLSWPGPVQRSIIIGTCS